MGKRQRQRPLDVDATPSKQLVKSRVESLVRSMVNGQFAVTKYVKDWDSALYDNHGNARINSNHTKHLALNSDNSREIARLTHIASTLYLRVHNDSQPQDKQQYINQLLTLQQFENDASVAEEAIADFAQIVRVPLQDLRLLASAQCGAIYGHITIKIQGDGVVYNGAPDVFFIDLQKYGIMRAERVTVATQHPLRAVVFLENRQIFNQCRSIKRLLQHFIFITGFSTPTTDFQRFAKIITQKLGIITLFLSDFEPRSLRMFIQYNQGTIEIAESYLHANPDMIMMGMSHSDIKQFNIPKSKVIALESEQLLEVDTMRKMLNHKFQFRQWQKHRNHLKIWIEVQRQLDNQAKFKKKVALDFFDTTHRIQQYISWKVNRVLSNFGYDEIQFDDGIQVDEDEKNDNDSNQTMILNQINTISNLTQKKINMQ